MNTEMPELIRSAKGKPPICSICVAEVGDDHEDYCTFSGVVIDPVTDLETDTCHVQMWTVVGGTVQHPGQILGRSTWADLHDLVTKQGGRRLTYDLFEVDNGDGTSTRYRANDAGLIP
jgi:hypothetical protein